MPQTQRRSWNHIIFNIILVTFTCANTSLLTPTTVTGAKRSSASVCVWLHDRTKMAKTTITKLATGIYKRISCYYYIYARSHTLQCLATWPKTANLSQMSGAVGSVHLMSPRVWSLAHRRISVTELSKSLDLKSGTVYRPHCGSHTSQSSSSRDC